jgi:hypothetical protein
MSAEPGIDQKVLQPITIELAITSIKELEEIGAV